MLLDKTERDRLNTMHREIDRNRFMIGCVLIRLALAAYLAQPPTDIVITRVCVHCGKPHGKPRLAQTASRNVEFSVSHAGEHVVVAFVLGTPIGIDVEKVESPVSIEPLIRDALRPYEIEALYRLRYEDRARGFLVYWTRKEAAVKAIGLGFIVPPTSLGVTGPGELPQLTSVPQNYNQLRHLSLYDVDVTPGYVASLAVIGDWRKIVPLDDSALID